MCSQPPPPLFIARPALGRTTAPKGGRSDSLAAALAQVPSELFSTLQSALPGCSCRVLGDT